MMPKPTLFTTLRCVLLGALAVFVATQFVCIADAESISNETGVVRIPIAALDTGKGNFFDSQSFDPAVLVNPIDNIIVSTTDVSQPQALRITQFNANPVADTLGISWRSAQGMRYDLLSDTNLATPIATWPVYKLTNLMAFPPENSLLLSPIPQGANRFFSIKAYPAQP